MSNERDELIAHLYDSAIPVNGAYAISAPTSADHLLEAGYRKPRTITTQAELDALPVGSMVKFNGAAFPLAAVKNWESKHPRKDGTPLSEWLTTGYEDPFDTGDLDFPAVILWEPGA